MMSPAKLPVGGLAPRRIGVADFNPAPVVRMPIGARATASAGRELSAGGGGAFAAAPPVAATVWPPNEGAYSGTRTTTAPFGARRPRRVGIADLQPRQLGKMESELGSPRRVDGQS